MHRYLAKTASRLAMVQVEDILDMERQANLPGTIQEYPNWRQRLPVPVTALQSDPRLKKTADIMKEEGR
jgi:4-alpha-glucanotransferase